MSDARVRNAFHEAGHAVVALAEGRRVGAISINGGLAGAALCGYSDGDGTIDALRAELRITVAGRIGEERAADANLTAPVPTAQTDADIYYSPSELRLYDRVVEIAAERSPDDPEPRNLNDDEYAAQLALDINPRNVAAEIAVARAFAWRTLALRSTLHDDIAAAVLQWGSLDGGSRRSDDGLSNR